MAVEHSQETLRKEVTDSVVKQIADYAYKMKQLVTVKSSNAWRNNFFREQLDRLSNDDNPGIPRGAEFPVATLEWDEVATYIQKYGLTETIPYEDIISNEFKIDDRIMAKLGEGVAWAVDQEIFSQLVQGADLTTGVAGLSNSGDIQSQQATGGSWSTSSAQIVKDVASAKKKIRDYYYNVNDFVLVVNGTDEVNLTHYLYEKGAQAPTVGVDMALNGATGKVAGAQVIITDVVPASYALLVVPKKCATWRELVPLGTDRTDRKYKDTSITVCEMGVTELTDPKAVVVLGTTREAMLG